MGSKENDKVAIEKEQAYVKTLAFDPKACVKLLGFKTVYIQKEAVDEFNKFYFSKKKDVDAIMSHHYLPETAQLRIYFPIRLALIKIKNMQFEASENGALLVDDDIKLTQSDLESAVVLGRKQTDTVIGTSKNIIKDGMILLTTPVKVHHIIDGNILVFDLGERDITACHDHHQGQPGHDDSKNENSEGENTDDDEGDEDSEEGDEEGGEEEEDEEENGEDSEEEGEEGGVESGIEGGPVGCIANHGGVNCTTAFGVGQGRCPFNAAVCMDFNGPFTDCVNAGGGWARYRNFIGSDCSVAMSMGECWNEVM